MKKLPPQTPEIIQARDGVLRQVEELAPSKTNVFRLSFEGLSLRKAITAKCLECSGLSTKEIRECTVYGCPLRNVRPYQNQTTEKAELAERNAEVNHGDRIL